MPSDGAATAAEADYFRRDQSGGITAPDLSKDCSFAAHIVRARGRRTRFTSISLDRNKIEIFGPAVYTALCADAVADGHGIVGHAFLLARLHDAAKYGDRQERLKALQASRYAKRRREGLIEWQFDVTRVERKELITWAARRVQKFFRAL